MRTKFKVTDEAFIIAVKACLSIRKTLIMLGMNATGSAYIGFKRRVKLLGVDTSHFLGQSSSKGTSKPSNYRAPLENILIENSSYTNGSGLKKRLLKEGVLQPHCYECGLKPEWNGKPLVLQLDHINGAHNGNRISNLRILCPNCHTQTDTFCSRNRVDETVIKQKSKRVKRKNCLDCDTLIADRNERCKQCSNKLKNKPKIVWPHIDELKRMIKETNRCAVARLLGVTDNAIVAHIKRHE
jgi:hypothetical protein